MNAPVSLARVDLIGVDALRALEPGAGEIAAIFRRSLYIRSGEAWACVGTPEIGAGPLNIVTDLRCDWSAMVSLGQSVSVDDRRLRIGVLALDLAGASVWSPPPFPDWDPARAEEGLAHLDGLLGAHSAPVEGLGCFAAAVPEPVSLEARAAAPLVARLSRWAAEGGGGDPEAVPLLGLGPGLTPSGDDFLAGFMAGLHAIHAFELRDSLWRTLVPPLAHATGPISRAHLECAAKGRLAERQHLILNAILAADADAIGVALAVLAGDEHTSSWDGLAGIASALRAILAGVDRPDERGSCNRALQLHTTR